MTDEAPAEAEPLPEAATLDALAHFMVKSRGAKKANHANWLARVVVGAFGAMCRG